MFTCFSQDCLACQARSRGGFRPQTSPSQQPPYTFSTTLTAYFPALLLLGPPTAIGSAAFAMRATGSSLPNVLLRQVSCQHDCQMRRLQSSKFTNTPTKSPIRYCSRLRFGPGQLHWHPRLPSILTLSLWVDPEWLPCSPVKRAEACLHLPER